MIFDTFSSTPALFSLSGLRLDSAILLLQKFRYATEFEHRRCEWRLPGRQAEAVEEAEEQVPEQLNTTAYEKSILLIVSPTVAPPGPGRLPHINIPKINKL